MSAENLSRLLEGGFQEHGTYLDDMSGFENPDLQALLVEFARRADVDPRRLAPESGGGGGSPASPGDAEHGLEQGMPLWLLVFQTRAERSAEWGANQQGWSRLLGAFYRAWLLDRFYAPQSFAMPANVEVFLQHLGKSNPSGFRPGYVGNGAARFELIGGGGPDYAAAASSKAFLSGLAHYGWRCLASGYAPGGKGVGHNCRVFLRQGRRGGDEFRPRPGDVVALRTAVGPLAGHIATVAWAETDGTRTGSLWFVSGNAQHASVSCDFARVVDTQGRPERGEVSIVQHCGNADLQPDRLALMDSEQLARVRCTRKPGEFPVPRQAGVASEPGLRPSEAAPTPQSTLGSCSVQTVRRDRQFVPTVIRVGAHVSEAPEPVRILSEPRGGGIGEPDEPPASAIRGVQLAVEVSAFADATTLDRLVELGASDVCVLLGDGGKARGFTVSTSPEQVAATCHILRDRGIVSHLQIELKPELESIKAAASLLLPILRQAPIQSLRFALADAWSREHSGHAELVATGFAPAFLRNKPCQYGVCGAVFHSPAKLRPLIAHADYLVPLAFSRATKSGAAVHNPGTTQELAHSKWKDYGKRLVMGLATMQQEGAGGLDAHSALLKAFETCAGLTEPTIEGVCYWSWDALRSDPLTWDFVRAVALRARG